MSPRHIPNAPTSPVKAEPANAGCWIAGHWGQYAVAQLVNIAAGHGYRDPATSPPFAQPDIVDIALRKLATMGPSTAPQLTDAEEEMLLWTVEDVEMWMNEEVAPAGFYFHWEDGEFFLSPKPCDVDDCDADVVYRDEYRNLCDNHLTDELERQGGAHDGCDHA